MVISQETKDNIKKFAGLSALTGIGVSVIKPQLPKIADAIAKYVTEDIPRHAASLDPANDPLGYTVANIAVWGTTLTGLGWYAYKKYFKDEGVEGK